MVDVKGLHERLTSWGQATLAKLQHRNWRIWLVAVVVAYVLMEAVRSTVSNASTLLLVWAFRGASWLIRQPMGLGGLALLVYFAALLGVAWWQSRPKSVAVTSVPVVPKERSQADEKIIQDLRTVWNRHGQVPVNQLKDLLRDVTYEVTNTHYWGVLLLPIPGDLERAVTQMSQAVSFNTSLSVEQVRERFNEMYGLYLHGIRWLAKLKSNGEIAFSDTRQRQLESWQENHYVFFEELQDLNQVPEHNQSLKIFIGFIDDQAFAEFLRAAESRPLPRRIVEPTPPPEG